MDVIHFVPTNISNSKKIIYASQDNRLEMLKIGLTNKAYIVDDRELCRGGTSYAIDTIKSISKQYGNANIYLIIGSDILSTIHKWKDFNHITRLSNIIVQSRVSKNIESLLNNELKSLISTDLGIFHAESYGKIYIQETSLVDISSTKIRDRLQKNQDISNLTPPLIEKWLLERKIY